MKIKCTKEGVQLNLSYADADLMVALLFKHAAHELVRRFRLLWVPEREKASVSGFDKEKG